MGKAIRKFSKNGNKKAGAGFQSFPAPVLYIKPGHVSVITGTVYFFFRKTTYRMIPISMPGSILPTVRENTSRMVGTQERPRTTATALSTWRVQRDAGVFPAKFLYASSQICLPQFVQRYSTISLYTVRKNSVPISLFLLPVGTFSEWPHPFLCPVTSNPPTTSVKSFIFVISVFILLRLFFVISFCFFFSLYYQAVYRAAI